MRRGSGFGFNRHLIFDGVNDYVSIPASGWDTWGQSSSLTYRAWLWFNNTSGLQALWLRSAGYPEYQWIFGVDFIYNGINFIQYESGGGFNVVAFSPPAPNRWVHVVFTFTRTPGALYQNCVRLYYNGIQQPQFASNNGIVFNTLSGNGRPVNIGARFLASTSWPFNGRMDELAFASRAWSVDEILADYNAGNASAPPLTDLFAHYKCDSNWDATPLELLDEVSGRNGTLNNFTNATIPGAVWSER